MLVILSGMEVRDRCHDLSDVEIDVLSSCDELEHGEEEEDKEGVAIVQGTPAAIAGERSLQRTSLSKSSPDSKRTRIAHGSATKLKSVTADQLTREFPHEHLSADCGKLVCRVCHTEVSLKMSILKVRVHSEHHKNGKDAHRMEEERQQMVKASFERYRRRHCNADSVSDLARTGLASALSDEISARRIQTVQSFLKAGIALQKIDHLRPLLEANNCLLTHSSHLTTYIPFILEEEDKQLHAEIASTTTLLVVFDGSTHLGEAVATIVRFVDTNWILQQRLVPSSRLVAAKRDGAAVNGAALRNMKEIMFPQLFDIICSSHSLDNVGRHFDIPLLDEFGQLWIGVFARSPAAKLKWKMRTGIAIKSHSNTRWWSYWEVLDQLLSQFADVEPFLENLGVVAPAYTRNLLSILHDADRLATLKIQLAVTIDAGRILVSKRT